MAKQVCIFNKTVWRAVLGAWWVASAVAWAQPSLAVHPLMVEEGMDAQRWNGWLMREVAKQKTQRVSEERVQRFLEIYDGSCKGDMDCLTHLSHSMENAYVLEVKVSRMHVDGMVLEEASSAPTELYVIHARVVDKDGVELKAVHSLKVAPVSIIDEEANAMATYAKLFEALQLEALFPPHRQPKSDSSEPQMPPWQQETTPLQTSEFDAGSSLRPLLAGRDLRAAYILTATFFVSGIGLGSIYMRGANADKKEFIEKYASKDKPRTLRDGADYEAAKKLADGIGRQRTGALFYFSVAGVAAATGITLYCLQKIPVRAGLTPTQGGALLSVQGSFR